MRSQIRFREPRRRCPERTEKGKESHNELSKLIGIYSARRKRRRRSKRDNVKGGNSGMVVMYSPGKSTSLIISGRREIIIINP